MSSTSMVDRAMAMKALHREFALWEQDLEKILNASVNAGSTGSPTRHSPDRSMNRSMKPSMNRSTNRSPYRSMNRSMNRSTVIVDAMLDDENLRIEETVDAMNKSIRRREELTSPAKRRSGRISGRSPGTRSGTQATSSSAATTSSEMRSSKGSRGGSTKPKKVSVKNVKPPSKNKTETNSSKGGSKHRNKNTTKSTKTKKTSSKVNAKGVKNEATVKEDVVFEQGYDSNQSSVVLHRSEGQPSGISSVPSTPQDNWSNMMGALAFGDNDPKLSPGINSLQQRFEKDLGNPSPSNDVLTNELEDDSIEGGNEYGGNEYGGNEYGGNEYGGNEYGGNKYGGNEYGGNEYGGNGGSRINSNRESSLPSHQPTEMTGLTGQLGLSDMSAISHHDSGDELDTTAEQGNRARAKMLLEEQQEIRLNLLLEGDHKERERLRERLKWTQDELQLLEE